MPATMIGPASSPVGVSVGCPHCDHPLPVPLGASVNFCWNCLHPLRTDAEERARAIFNRVTGNGTKTTRPKRAVAGRKATSRRLSASTPQ
jgi:hypothetical protein